jgi:hypothetical protein
MHAMASYRKPARTVIPAEHLHDILSLPCAISPCMSVPVMAAKKHWQPTNPPYLTQQPYILPSPSTCSL